MSELFLELFTEEIPTNLQVNARESLVLNIKKFLDKENISYKGKSESYSTPNRLIIYFENIQTTVVKESKEIRGPNINASQEALDGFVKSNEINKKNIYKKKTEKGTFYFFKTSSNKIKTIDLFQENLASILEKISWKKSMKWGENEMYWGRPLKSILSVFGGSLIKFKFHHLESSYLTFLDKEFEEKTKKFTNFKEYNTYFKNIGVILDHNLRKKSIKNQLNKISKKKGLVLEIDEKLLNEVSNLVDSPSIILCQFNSSFLSIPNEILITTMKNHQKYFPTFDNKNNLTNNFLVVANIKDIKGMIKNGNQRVVEARLNDAQFFWEKNKSQSLVKQVSKLNNVNFFKGLGTYLDKVHRIRKLSGLISDELLISKEKIEIASSICKVDLLSDLVAEFPELQGIMGGYFAEQQGFEKEVCLAVREHYLPLGPESKIPKKLYSLALSFSDKLDTLVGFFGIGLKPTSSRDPYALRRSALGLMRLIIENNKNFNLKELINYSCTLYDQQRIRFNSKEVIKELNIFFVDRVKNYMKEKNIRSDIIESATSSYGIDNILKIYKKSTVLNKLISKNVGDDLLFSYRRASNILNDELKDKKIELSSSVDPVLFKTDYENYLYQKVQNLRKYFSNIDREESYEKTLNNLASLRKEVSDFFDNVIVNDKDASIKKNRLELLQMLCKTFDNYLNFSKIESI